jgi:xanthine dehydrogenase YagT iron-sulfur-binding subunit
MKTGERFMASSDETWWLTRRDALKSGGAAAALLVTGTSFPMTSAAEADVVSVPAPAGTMPLRLKINGRDHTLALDPRTTLLDTLREHLQLTGSKKGCDHGQCGACTVLVNGRRINACLTLALMHEGDEITTIEGLATGDRLHPLQAAFVAQDGLQCGYCTPGQICSAVGMLQEVEAG